MNPNPVRQTTLCFLTVLLACCGRVLSTAEPGSKEPIVQETRQNEMTVLQVKSAEGAERAVYRLNLTKHHEPARARSDIIQRWESWRFGAFVCFNLNQFTGEELTKADDPKVYHPAQLDVSGWVAAFKAAGMRYAVLTARHTAPFLLWDSATTEIDVAASGNTNDVCCLFVEECRRQGIAPAFYYCLWGGEWNPAPNARAVILAQLYELATRYGEIPYFWIDMMNWAPTNLSTQEIYDALKNLQPNTIVEFNQHVQDGTQIKYWPTDVVDGEMVPPPASGHQPLRSVRGKNYYLPFDYCFVSQSRPGGYDYDPLGKSCWFTYGEGRSFVPSRPFPAEALVRKAHEGWQRGANNVLLAAAPDHTGRMRSEDVEQLKTLGTLLNPPRFEGRTGEALLAKGGSAKAAIVVGRDAVAFHHWVAEQLQRYLRQLSGALLPIVRSDKIPPLKPLIILGGPTTNPLAAAAQAKGLVHFADLKPEGFVLKRTELEDAPVLLAGGNDETGTMYAVYELLERLGIVFQLTGDVIPEQKPDLVLPTIDVRIEPALKHRGMHCCHGIRWYMSLSDFRNEIDQLAKLKLNVLQFYWGMGGPWAEFTYGGKKPEIIYPKESGYCAWAWNSGTAKSIKVGRECFPQDYLGPPEFAKVQTQEEAYRTAREFLREVIRYAHSRKVQVWLALGEMTYVPPSLVPPPTKKLGFSPFYCGVAIPHGDPAMLDIWEAALCSMIETYPEADRYWVVTGSEAHIAADDPQTQALIRDYARVRDLLPQKAPAAMDTDLADVAAADKLIRRIRARYPSANLGAEMIFRGGQLRALDTVLPKDIWLMNMVNWEGETAMSDFDRIQGRELVVWPRITDDGCELNIQLNALMYDHDETIAGSVRYGLTGILGQLNKARGAEQSAQYIAEGAWNPTICCQSFYERYLRRLFGPDAMETLLKAYLLLEENEKALGWHGRKGLFGTYHHGNAMGIDLRKIDYRMDKPAVDRPKLEKAIAAAAEQQLFWQRRVTHCRKALELLRQARAKVLPGSRGELDYVIYKTENFVTVMEELDASSEAKAAFDRALLAMNAGEAAEVNKELAQAQAALDRANRLVQEAAQQMIPYAKVPTERHILYLFNDAIPSHESARQYLADVLAFRKELNPKR